METLQNFITEAIYSNKNDNKVYSLFDLMLFKNKGKLLINQVEFNNYCEQLINISKDNNSNSKSKWFCIIGKEYNEYILYIGNDTKTQYYKIYWPTTKMISTESRQIQRLRNNIISIAGRNINNQVTVLQKNEKLNKAEINDEYGVIYISPKIINELIKQYCYKLWFFYGGRAHGEWSIGG